ncbi:hypothetical protein ACFSZS_15565 [Seohaeicola zhoushanensis]
MTNRQITIAELPKGALTPPTSPCAKPRCHNPPKARCCCAPS